MLPDKRRELILRLLEEREVARPAFLAEQAGVSVETIRRDLVSLEQEGAVHRVYGGVARARLSHSTEPSRAERLALQGGAKAEIAALVAGIIEDSDTVIFDVGTTVEMCAQAVAPSFHGRVITNSVPVATRLASRSGLDVHLLGGHVRPDELSCSGPDTVALLKQFHADKAILGSGGVHPQAGLTDYHLDEIAVRLAMIDAAQQVYVVADAIKIGHVALRKVCDWGRITAVITDSSADPAQVARLREAGVEVLQGRPSDQDASVSDQTTSDSAAATSPTRYDGGGPR
ncbi:DeoR/GlpR transcriptional regulator [Planosporangium thailandense]|uniref:DeoR/GlpR transcriptional regulator n=1 Tax=Planosporangium thailandense TaxID=765197 RepID=A0ABX0Y0V7_9ACTN|nr:DeoR/GlpR family DNA-binding transcription regulator [Planosporangium thailandense]NJC71972.1 DeoR/GlpR transcriptional regulator [Planosporangium thailandense]